MARSRRRRPRSVWPLATIVAVAALAVTGVVVLAAQRLPGSTTTASPAAVTAHSTATIARAAATASATAATTTPVSTPTASPTPAPTPAAHAWSGLRATSSQIWMGDMTLIYSWPGGLLARGWDSPTMKYSADGKTWVAAGDPATFGNESGLMDGIAWNGRLLVATGQITGAGAPTPTVWTSTDGRAWSVADTGGTYDPPSRMAALAANTAAIVGVTSDGRTWRSADGRTWIHAALPDSKGTRIVQAIATSKVLAVVGLNGGDGAQVPNKGVTIWSSTDGSSWKSKVLTAADWGWEKLFVLNDRLIAYEGATPEASKLESDNDVKRVLASGDGYDWTPFDAAPPAGFDVVGSNGAALVAQKRMTAAGSAFLLDQSVDGAHWTGLPIEVPAKSMEQARAVGPNGVFIAVSPVGALTYFEADR